MSKARETVETLRTVLVDGDVTNANFTGADLEVGKGGTGASSAGAARTALGLVVGTDVLAPDGNGSGLTGVDSLPSQTSQTGKFLTTNGSAASWGEAGGGAWTILSTVTTTNNSTTTVDLTGMDSTYNTYVVMFTKVKSYTAPSDPSNDARFGCRLQVGGAWKTGSYDASVYQRSMGNFAGNGGTGGNEILFTTAEITENSTADASGVFYFHNTTNTASYASMNGWFQWEGGTTISNTEVLGIYKGALGATTGVRFFFKTGPMYAGATFTLYGIKHT